MSRRFTMEFNPHNFLTERQKERELFFYFLEIKEKYVNSNQLNYNIEIDAEKLIQLIDNYNALRKC